MPRYDIITFDCYGTLIDWASGITRAIAEAARAAGLNLVPEAIFPAYSRAEKAVETASYRPYRVVLAETARHVAAELGWSLAATGATFLVESLPSWQPFPDTNPALEQLRAAGYQLGILSNVDDDLLSATRRHFSVDFELIVTAQQVASYKPAHPHFLEARERIATSHLGARWLHAAQSHYHDIAPAHALGIPAAWVNRDSEPLLPGAARPTLEVRDLCELADRLVGEG